jgi:hypothetical protein
MTMGLDSVPILRSRGSCIVSKGLSDGLVGVDSSSLELFKSMDTCRGSLTSGIARSACNAWRTHVD